MILYRLVGGGSRYEPAMDDCFKQPFELGTAVVHETAREHLLQAKSRKVASFNTPPVIAARFNVEYLEIRQAHKDRQPSFPG